MYYLHESDKERRIHNSCWRCEAKAQFFLRPVTLGVASFWAEAPRHKLPQSYTRFTALQWGKGLRIRNNGSGHSVMSISRLRDVDSSFRFWRNSWWLLQHGSCCWRWKSCNVIVLELESPKGQGEAVRGFYDSHGITVFVTVTTHDNDLLTTDFEHCRKILSYCSTLKGNCQRKCDTVVRKFNARYCWATVSGCLNNDGYWRQPQPATYPTKT